MKSNSCLFIRFISIGLMISLVLQSPALFQPQRASHSIECLSPQTLFQAERSEALLEKQSFVQYLKDVYQFIGPKALLIFDGFVTSISSLVYASGTYFAFGVDMMPYERGAILMIWSFASLSLIFIIQKNFSTFFRFPSKTVKNLIEIFLKFGSLLLSPFRSKKREKLNWKERVRIAGFVLFIGTMGTFLNLLHRYIPLSESLRGVASTELNNSKIDEEIMALMWDKELAMYPFGFSKKELSNFLKHNRLLRLSVENIRTPSGRIPTDHQGYFRARFILTVWQAAKDTIVPLLKKENGQWTDESKVQMKYFLFYSLHWASIYRNEMFETPLRDKLGMRPGTNHADLNYIVRYIGEIKEKHQRWLRAKKRGEQVDFSQNNHVYWLIKRRSTIQTISEDSVNQTASRLWNAYFNNGGRTFEEVDLEELEQLLTSRDSLLTLRLNSGNRSLYLNPLFIPEKIDSWDQESYSRETLTKGLRQEGTYYEEVIGYLEYINKYLIAWEFLSQEESIPSDIKLKLFFRMHFHILDPKHALNFVDELALKNITEESAVRAFYNKFKSRLPASSIKHIFENEVQEVREGSGTLFSDIEDALLFPVLRQKSKQRREKDLRFGSLFRVNQKLYTIAPTPLLNSSL